jgi:hypothetical protein
VDLSTFEINDLANEGVKMELLNPDTFEPLMDDAGQPMWIKLKGIDSDAHKGVTRSATNRRLQQQFEHGGSMRIRAEDMEAEALVQLIKCTVDWHLQFGKQTPACTPDEARTVYQRFPWIKDQCEKWRTDRSHFFASSKMNSLPMPNGMSPHNDE